MKHGSRTYSFRSERVDDFMIALREQIEVISNLIKNIQRNAVLQDHTTNEPGRNSLTLTACISQTESAANLGGIQAEEFSQRCTSGSALSQNSFGYENLGSTSSASGSKYESEFDSDSTEFNSFPESVNYELPGESSWENSEYSSYCTDIYPFFNNSFDSKEFNYERLGSESDRRASAPEPSIIYQDVDISLDRKYFYRRRSRLNSKPAQPTFISYIEGGSEALKAIHETRIRCSSEPSQSSTDFEGSGVYCKLFDPKLLNIASQRVNAKKNDAAYDFLQRDFSNKSELVQHEKTPH